MQEFDVAIVGSGFSGLSALMLALGKGAKCALISNDFGASQYFSGALDLIDPRLLQSNLKCEEFFLAQTLRQFCDAHPHHFYTHYFQNSNSSPKHLVSQMQKTLQYYDIPFVGDGEQGVWAIGSQGNFKPTAFAWQTQALTAQQWQAAKRILVLGFRGVFEYSAQNVARQLQSHFKKNVDWQEICEFEVMPASPYVSILRLLETEQSFQSWCGILRQNLKNYDLIVVPPILNSKFSTMFASEFQGRVCEMLSVLPSVAGLRLQTVVRESLKSKNVTQIHGKAQNAVCVDKHRMIHSIQVQTTEGIEIVQAKNWVLATGKFLGGGLEHKANSFVEPLLNLPLAIDQIPLKLQTHMTQLIQKNPSASQAFLKVGVTPFSQTSFLNLSICGHLLTGFDFSREQCGFGVSVASAQITLS